MWISKPSPRWDSPAPGRTPMLMAGDTRRVTLRTHPFLRLGVGGVYARLCVMSRTEAEGLET